MAADHRKAAAIGTAYRTRLLSYDEVEALSLAYAEAVTALRAVLDSKFDTKLGWADRSAKATERARAIIAQLPEG